jgi:hypothetical protein
MWPRKDVARQSGGPLGVCSGGMPHAWGGLDRVKGAAVIPTKGEGLSRADGPCPLDHALDRLGVARLATLIDEAGGGEPAEILRSGPRTRSWRPIFEFFWACVAGLGVFLIAW